MVHIPLEPGQSAKVTVEISVETSPKAAVSDNESSVANTTQGETFEELDNEQQTIAPTAAMPAESSSPADPRTWSWIQWLCAALGFIIGFAVWAQWKDWPSNDLNGFIAGLLAFLWWVAHVGVGFFGFGLLAGHLGRSTATR